LKPYGRVVVLQAGRFWPRNSEIDPIFLTKSDDLIRAELQLQRQRLERALRDQVVGFEAIRAGCGAAGRALLAEELCEPL
jgi:hypothetical protein